MSQTHKALRGGGTISNRSFAENSAYVSNSATVDDDSYLGHGSFVGTNSTIGKRVLICNLVRIGNNVTVGDDVTIECGNVIPNGTVIPPGSTLLDPCCSTPPVPPEGAMLQFDSINAVGTRLAVFDTTGFTKGTLAYVGNDTFADQNSVHDYYTLVYGENLTVPTYGNMVVNSPTFGVDGAQWRRNLVPNQQALQKLIWSVDPRNVSGVASDENTGWGTSEANADAHPLRSMHELNARLTGYQNDLNLTIHFMSAPFVQEFTVLDSLQGAGTTNYITIKGNLVPVDGGATGLVITAVQAAVPATNTERTVTIAGLGLAPQYLNMMIRRQAGGKVAYVTRQPGADVLAISQPRSSDIIGGPGGVVDFAPGDVVDIVDMTKMCDWPFPDTGVPWPNLAWFRLDANGSGHFPQGKLGAGNPQFAECIFGDPTALNIASYNLTAAPGVNVLTFGCQMSGQHANVISGGYWLNYSLAIAIGGDGPQVQNSNWQFASELNFVGINGSPGFRQLAGGPFNVLFFGDGACQIACFGTVGCAFDMWQPQHAPSGNFIARPDAVPPGNVLKWYGVTTGGGAGLRLLTLGVGTKSQLPFSAGLTVTTAGQKPIVIDGVEYDFADVPINTLSGATLAG